MAPSRWSSPAPGSGTRAGRSEKNRVGRLRRSDAGSAAGHTSPAAAASYPQPRMAPGFSILPIRGILSTVLKVDKIKIGPLPPLSFEVARGECLAGEGPSGSGKTRLLRGIAD